MKARRFLLPLLLFSFVLSGCVETGPPAVPFAVPFEGDGDDNPQDGDGGNGAGDQEPGDGDAQGDSDGNGDGDPILSNGYDGDPCQADNDCLSNFCFEDPDWPGGYCSTIECATRADCESANDENACLQNPQGANFCIRLCDPSTPADCREGYQCQAVGGVGQGWCAPSPGGGSDFQGDLPFSIQCQSASSSTVNLNYSIGGSTSSYMIVPITSNGNWLNPRFINTPSGTQINFNGSNSFQAAGAQLFGVVNPTVVPAAPQFQNQLQSGSHTYRLSTADSEICYYKIESTGTPTTIDFNIYLLGLDGINLNSANAAGHPHMQSMLSHVEGLLQQSNISLGEVRFPSLPSSVEEQYRIIRSQGDVGRLASNSAYPNSTVDGALSANIFIVERFAFSGGGGVLGLSQGIPGAAGLHGTSISGVALTGEYLGYSLGGGVNGNHFIGNVLVHELGHFLGLFHTSETHGQAFDPLGDTPQCSNFQRPWECPDWGNLMFPMADNSNTALTNDQSFVIRVNPLTK